MFRILDRYIIRELLLPLAISLVLLTFILVIPPLIQNAQSLISKGVPFATVGHVVLLLLPQALSLTIPMALLLGILIGFGRLSADREFVAMQASGVSLYRLLRPIALLALVATAADAYEIIVALPDANQTFREITFNIVASHAESNIAPRVFDNFVPNHPLYVRDTQSGGGGRDVFLADTSDPDHTTVYFAKTGRLVANRAQRTVVLELTDATRHTTSTKQPDEYEGADYQRVLIHLDPDKVFPRVTPTKGFTEMSIAELKAAIAKDAERHDPGNAEQFMIQQKFAIPAAALVLAVIGLALGASPRKDGRLASFTLGFGVIFVYYVILWTARAASYAGRFPPALGPWVPNIVFGVAGVALFMWRARSADQPIRISIPTFWRRVGGGHPTTSGPAPGPSRGGRVVLVVRVPHLNLPRPPLLDLYISREYLRIFALGLVSLMGIFYISTFMDLADKLFRGSATTAMLLRYFYFVTPQYVYYVIPMSALVATLVTIGVMTKNSELVVMRACGISLYRAAAPLLLFALVASAVLFGLQERVIAYSNREADRLNRQIRGYPVETFTALDRRWMVGEHGDVYHYDFFDPRRDEFRNLAIYHLSGVQWDLSAITHAARVALVHTTSADGEPALEWHAADGWVRRFSTTSRGGTRQTSVAYAPFAERALPLESAAYFKTEQPDPDLMTYRELNDYVAKLRAGGYNAVPYMVSLQTKIAFPLVTLVMTLIAVPFAVTTGRRGAMYGIGIGIVLAITYRLVMVLFAAAGAGGLLAPSLAAWAPNILFAAVAVYLLLTVRT